jgi:hypothetical protein
MKALSAAAILLLVAACATVPRAPAVLDPVGRFEFSTLFQGQPLDGTIEITGAAGAYTGRLMAGGIPEIPLSTIAAEGSELVVGGMTPSGELRMRMVFVGSEFTGGWTLGGESGEVTGRRLP